MTAIETKICIKEKIVKNLGRSREKWVLWHVTGRCNIECPYCYGSFNGGSYKTDYSVDDDLSLDILKTAALDLKSLGFNRIHINGGEPILRKDIIEFLRYLKTLEMRVWFLTNATTQLRKIELIIKEELVELLAVSVDSKDAATINLQRERGEIVLENLSKISTSRAKNESSVKLGVYCVATKFSAPRIPELLDHLIDLEIDYFNVQPMFLPDGHPFHAASITSRDVEVVKQYIGHMRTRASEIEISTDANLLLSEVALETPGAYLNASDCFAQHGRYLFIGPGGEVLGCPSIPPDHNLPLGNIVDGRIRSFVSSSNGVEGKRCRHLSLDCLGMYEMAYRDD